MKIFNSLTRQLAPLSDPLTFYSCGPTVYDHAHIGNFRTYIVEDILRRTLKQSGLKLKHVMNITDVDDKTINRARQMYPKDEPRSALRKLTGQFEEFFFADATKFGIDFSASKIVRATEHIADMQKLILAIPNKYVTDDGVYFNLEEYQGYGELTKLDRSHAHHRIDNDEYDKEHVADFALWKAQKAGEPGWDFELDGKNIKGRPGWHIECSAMSVKYLGQPFELHSGGVDLKFPHHENEIAQAKAASGESLAKVFMHVEHLLVDTHKMSKSLNNFYTLEDIIKKGFDPLAFRLLVLQAHYRSQLNFTWESLEAAQRFLQKLRAFADLRWQESKINDRSFLVDPHMTKDKIIEYLDNDLNTPMALAELAQFVDRANAGAISRPDLNAVEQFISFLDQILGLDLGITPDITSAQKELITNREKAREAQDWGTADSLRQKLEDQAIAIRDTESGPIWSRV